jgi:hypothetical protein
VTNEINPFYDVNWGVGTGTKFYRAYAEDLPVFMNKYLMDKKTAEAMVHKNLNVALRIVSALAAWNVMLESQLREIIERSSNGKILSAMWSLNIVQMGFAIDDKLKRIPYPLYKTDKNTAIKKFILKHVSVFEEMKALGGREITKRARNPRHDTIGLHFVKTIIEECPGIDVAIGEDFSELKSLFGLPQEKYIGAGDATLFRKDGLRIVIETTARRPLHEKFERWAKLLSSHTLLDSGVCVLFVDVMVPQDRIRWEKLYHRRMLREIQKTTEQYPLSDLNKFPRMFFADYRDYVLPTGETTESVKTLTCLGHYRNKWMKIPLGDTRILPVQKNTELLDAKKRALYLYSALSKDTHSAPSYNPLASKAMSCFGLSDMPFLQS